MWGGVGAGKLGVSLQTGPSCGWGGSSAGLVHRQTVRGFKAPRSRDTKAPDRIKQKQNKYPNKEREGEHWLEKILIFPAQKKALK